MTGWVYFTDGSCPICWGLRPEKDCRQNLITYLVHCRYKNANPLDWSPVKYDKLGFMMWRQKSHTKSYKGNPGEAWKELQRINNPTKKCLKVNPQKIQ